MNRKERKQQGDAGEAYFRDWLERSGLPYVTVEQDQASFPRHLKHAIKRPDFEVGVPTLGRVAVEVKHKSLYGSGKDASVYLDISEIERLDNYEDSFATVVWWFFKDPQSEACWLVQNRIITNALPDEPDYDTPAKVPMSMGSPTNPAKHGFLEALAFAAGIINRSSASRRSSTPRKASRGWFARRPRQDADTRPS